MSRKYVIFAGLVLAFAFLFLNVAVIKAETWTWTGQGDTHTWTDPANWGLTGGGYSALNQWPGATTTADVVIGANARVIATTSITSVAKAGLKSITLGVDGGGGSILTIAGGATINATTTSILSTSTLAFGDSATNTLAIGTAMGLGSGRLNLYGSDSTSTPLTIGNVAYFVPGTSTVTYLGTGGIYIATTTYYNLSLTPTSTAANSPINSYNNTNSVYTIGNGGNIAVQRVLTLNASSTLNMNSKQVTLSNSIASANPDATSNALVYVSNGFFIANNSTVVYSGTVATNVATGTYATLQISSATTKTLVGSTTVATVNVNSGATFSLPSINFTVGGNITVATSTTFSQTSTATTTMSATGTIGGGGSITFNNLKIIGGTTTNTSDITISNNIWVDSGGPNFFLSNNTTVNIAGNFLFQSPTALLRPTLGNGILNFNASSGTKVLTLSNTPTSGGVLFNPTFNATGATYTFPSWIDTHDQLIVNGGTLDFSGTTVFEDGPGIQAGYRTFLEPEGDVFIASGATIIPNISTATTVINFIAGVDQLYTDKNSSPLDMGKALLDTGTNFKLGSNAKFNSIITPNKFSEALTPYGYTLTLTGTSTPLQLNGATFTAGTSTINYAGSGNITVASTTYYNVQFTGSSSTSTVPSGSIIISNSGTIGAGNTLDVSNATYTNNGTITEQTGAKIVKASVSNLASSNGSQTTVTSFGNIDSLPTVYVTVVDTSLNLLAGTIETLSATITAASKISSNAQTVTLTETGAATGIFSGGIAFILSGSPITGSLAYQGDGTVSYSWTDFQDSADTGSGGTASFSGTTPGGGGGGGGGSNGAVAAAPAPAPAPAPVCGRPSLAASKRADTNDDGKVNILDFNSLMVNWGRTNTGNVADLDLNCKVDLFDFNSLMIYWTK